MASLKKGDATGKRRLPCVSTLFSYKGFETKAGGKDDIIIPDGDKVLIVHRNKETEKDFIRKLETLHSNFISPKGT